MARDWIEFNIDYTTTRNRIEGNIDYTMTRNLIEVNNFNTAIYVLRT